MKMFEKNTKNESFETFLGRDVGILRIIGLRSMNSIFTDKVKKSMIWETVIIGIGIINLLMVVFFELRKVIEESSENLAVAIGLTSEVISGLLCIIKGLRLWIWQEELRKLLRSLAIMWDDLNLGIGVRKESMKIAAETYYVGKLIIVMVLSASMSYVARPYINLLNYHLHEKSTNASYDYSVTVYTVTYPWSTETTIRYIMCISWEQFTVVFFALCWISSDVIFAQLTAHVAIQFRVLWHDLENVTNVDDKYDGRNERILIDRLSTIAKRHRDLYTYCEMIQQIFNPILFLKLILTAANMCLCAFHFQKEFSQGNWNEVAKSLLHAIIVTTDGFIYCGYSEKLTQQSSLMAQAAWNCQWTDRSKEFKIILHIIMMRSQRPFVCTACGFFSVNLSRMTAIFKAAGSYFALLNSLT